MVATYQPQSTLERIALFRAMLQKTGKLIGDFRGYSAAERDLLRQACVNDSAQLGFIATEARQLLRTEDSYQDWLKINANRR
jgi:hypothetical protein